jgi:hypothetical protein
MDAGEVAVGIEATLFVIPSASEASTPFTGKLLWRSE